MTAEPKNIDVETVVPKTGFFARYVRYARDLTDAADIFHVSSALAFYSALVANYAELSFEVQVGSGKMRRSRSPLHCWEMLVSPAGEGRKTTAIKMAKAVAAEAVGGQEIGLATPEATFDAVKHRPDGFFCYEEGSTLFDLFKANYWQHSQDLFLRLYDGNRMVRELTGVREKKKGIISPPPIRIVVPRPRTSLIMGIAPSLLDETKVRHWSGGLISRMCLVYATRERYEDTLLEDPDEAEALAHELVQTRATFEQAKKDNGGRDVPISFTKSAFLRFRDWCREVDVRMRTRPDRVRSLYNRVQEHTKRHAGLYAISCKHYSISMDTIEPAIRYGNVSLASIDYLSGLLSEDRVMRHANLIVEFLKPRLGVPVSAKEISQELQLSYHTLTPAVNSLLSAGKVGIGFENRDGEKWLTLLPNVTRRPPKRTI